MEGKAIVQEKSQRRIPRVTNVCRMMSEAPTSHVGEESKPQHCWGLSFSENTGERCLTGDLSPHHPLPQVQATKTDPGEPPLPAVQLRILESFLLSLSLRF